MSNNVCGVNGNSCAGSSPVSTALDQCATERKQGDGTEQKANNAAAVKAMSAAFPMLAPFAGLITGVLNFVTSAG
jgi:hypothetical protein